MTTWFLRRCATALILVFVLVTAVFFVVFQRLGERYLGETLVRGAEPEKPGSPEL